MGDAKNPTEFFVPPSDTPSKIVPCRSCDENIECPGWVFDMAKRFNHQLVARADEGEWFGMKDFLIRENELVACDACARDHRAQCEVKANDVYWRGHDLLQQTRKGFGLESKKVRWLHDNGFGDTLNAIFRSQQKSSNRTTEL